jgi:hypothetical protein
LIVMTDGGPSRTPSSAFLQTSLVGFLGDRSQMCSAAASVWQACVAWVLQLGTTLVGHGLDRVICEETPQGVMTSRGLFIL